MKRVVVSLLSAAALLLAARPAAAQGMNFAAGYQFLKVLEDGGESVPGGWNASVSGGPNSMITFVGEVAGNYKEGDKLHTFQGGVDIGGRNPQVQPFVRVLTGVGVFSGGGDSQSVFAFTPEVGVRLFGQGNVGAQLGVGFPIFHDNGETMKTVRLFVGIAFRSKK
jgi:hypothetical protein